jgi:hypothetical protein
MAHESTVNPYEHISDQVLMKKHSRGSISAESLSLNDLASINSSTAAKLNEKLASIVDNKISPLTDTNRNIYFGSSGSTTSTVDVAPQIKTKEASETNEIKVNESKEHLNLLKPVQPSELTHHEDFDDDDEDSDESKSSPTISAK